MRGGLRWYEWAAVPLLVPFVVWWYWATYHSAEGRRWTARPGGEP